MRAVFRVDASVEMGIGHVMRCLTLADELRGKSVESAFVCNRLVGDMRGLIREKGYQVYEISLPVSHAATTLDKVLDAEKTISVLKEQEHINWLIVDHYGLDRCWEACMRSFANRIMVIDDLADREHYCDLLLDQNIHEKHEERYDALVPAHCRKLFGPRFALLRSEFLEVRKGLRQRNNKVQRILVSFGGADFSNETHKALSAITSLKRPDIDVDVVVGFSNPHKTEIETLCSRMPNCTYHCQTSNMAELMGQADLCIGAGGSTTWERCCLGLPSLVVGLADNQKENIKTIHEKGAALNLGRHEEVSAKQISSAIGDLLRDEQLLQEMSSKGMELIDGKGANRVARALMSGRISLRQVRDSDCKLLWEWANDPLVRRSSFNSDPISWEEHQRWFVEKRSDRNYLQLIAENGESLPIGQIRFDLKGCTAAISYSLEVKSRGMGLGTDLLLEGMRSLADHPSTPTIFLGRVKTSNISSRKAFEKAGFSWSTDPESPNVCLYQMRVNRLKN